MANLRSNTSLARPPLANMPKSKPMQSGSRTLPTSLIQLFNYLSSTTFTHLAQTEYRNTPLPVWYSCSSFPYAIVGCILLSYPLLCPTAERYQCEGLAWLLVGLTSHVADVTFFGEPGMNVVVDSLWAPTCLLISVYNCGFWGSVLTVPIPLFYFLRGQTDDPANPRKVADHARWHWLGQGLRIVVLLIQDPPRRAN